jgi:hypothetical protein
MHVLKSKNHPMRQSLLTSYAILFSGTLIILLIILRWTGPAGGAERQPPRGRLPRAAAALPLHAPRPGLGQRLAGAAHLSPRRGAAAGAPGRGAHQAPGGAGQARQCRAHEDTEFFASHAAGD